MVDTIQYAEQEIGNGDPVVAIRYNRQTDGQQVAKKTVTLGTGFEGWDNAFNQVGYAMKTGHSTQNITRENADEIQGADRVDLFTIAGTVTQE